MGKAKQDKLEADFDSAARWATKARIEGYECRRCGNIPEFEEREIYFETGLCGWCEHQAAKDD